MALQSIKSTNNAMNVEYSSLAKAMLAHLKYQMNIVSPEGLSVNVKIPVSKAGRHYIMFKNDTETIFIGVAKSIRTALNKEDITRDDIIVGYPVYSTKLYQWERDPNDASKVVTRKINGVDVPQYKYVDNKRVPVLNEDGSHRTVNFIARPNSGLALGQLSADDAEFLMALESDKVKAGA